MPFCEQTLDFLFENRLRNSKEWFEAHRDQYTKFVVEPLADLTMALAPTVLGIDDQLICDPRIGKSLSRIRRDTRFTTDNSLYRDSAWCGFMRNKKIFEGPPGFFVELTPRFVRWGVGYYSASKESMQAFRELVAQNHPLFIQTAAMAASHPNLVLEGESYKRSKRPDLPALQQDYINRKNVCFIRMEDTDMLLREDLADIIARDFITLTPAYQLFMLTQQRKANT